MFEEYRFNGLGGLYPSLDTLLKTMWNTAYLDLYDGRYFPDDIELSESFSKDISNLLGLCLEVAGPNSLRTMIRFFCEAVYPSISAYYLSKNEGGLIAPFDDVLEYLRGCKNLSIEAIILPSVRTIPGYLAEPYYVFEESLEVLKGKNLREGLEEIIDMCIAETGIQFGSVDHRPIFNWFLNYVVPAAVLNETLSIIYSCQTPYEEGWSFRLVKDDKED